MKQSRWGSLMAKNNILRFNEADLGKELRDGKCLYFTDMHGGIHLSITYYDKEENIYRRVFRPITKEILEGSNVNYQALSPCNCVVSLLSKEELRRIIAVKILKGDTMLGGVLDKIR